MAAGSHFGCPKITLYRISYHYRSIPPFYFVNIFYKMAAGGHFGCPKITFCRIFWPFQINTKLLSFYFCKIASGYFGCPKITFCRIFWPFQINTKLLSFYFCKIASGAHFGCPNFDRISGHYRSICNLLFFFDFFLQNGCRRPFRMSENHFRSHFWPFQINTQLFFLDYRMAAVGHFGCPKFTLDHISGYFRSIQSFIFYFFYKMAAGGHFGCPKFTLDHISGHFISIQIFFGISGHFRSIQNFFSGGHFGCL